MTLQIYCVLLEFAVLDYYDHYFGADDADGAARFGGVFAHADATVHHCLFAVAVRTGDNGLLSILGTRQEVNWC